MQELSYNKQNQKVVYRKKVQYQFKETISGGQVNMETAGPNVKRVKTAFKITPFCLAPYGFI